VLIDGIVWCVSEMIKRRVGIGSIGAAGAANQGGQGGLKALLLHLFRQISVNVKDQRSMTLNKAMVHIIHGACCGDQRIPLFCPTDASNNYQPDGAPFASLIFLKLLRLICEHYESANLIQLWKKEAQICMHIWNNNKDECHSIGREFLRVFIDVAKIPEFKPIADDLARDFNGKPLSMHIFENQGIR